MRFYAPLYLPRPSTRVALKSSNSPMRILHLMRIDNDVVEAIGNTPLIKLKHASNATGCIVLGKAEFMNPGQSVKDRAGKQMILEAERRGDLKPGGLVVEGTAGNTGIGLAIVASARGYRTMIVIPETQSREKKDMLRLCGAELVEVPALPTLVHLALSSLHFAFGSILWCLGFGAWSFQHFPPLHPSASPHNLHDVTSPTLWLLAAALLLASCSQGDPDATARAIAEANRHIESGAELVTRLSKLNEFTQPYEIAATLRRFTHDTQEWRRTYAAQHAKLTARRLSRDQLAELTRRYKATVEDLKTKVEQTERRLAKRSDTKLYYAELLRMREAVRQL